MLRRCEQNPLIGPADVSPSTEGFQVVGAFNPGAVVFGNEILLLVRVSETCLQQPGKIRVPTVDFASGRGVPGMLEFDENDPDLARKDTRGVAYRGQDYLTSMSHLRLARSTDGIHFKVELKPFLFPSSAVERFGVEDARVLPLGDDYYINYTAVSADSWCTALARTRDFVTVERLGVIFHPENKDVVLFPETIHGRYAALHRPNNHGFGKPSIWYAESPDLLHWGNHRVVIRPRPTPFEALKIGAGSAPIRTAQGWLVIYHGKGENSRYALFPLLLDLDEPWRVVQRGSQPILEPQRPYETDGFFGHVVFTNGLVARDGQLFVYYGAADQCCCLATATVADVLAVM